METQHSGQPARSPGAGFLAPPVEPDEVGRLAHYRVLKELGRGGMGAVYLAEDTLLGRRVALKVMLPEVAAGDAARARFVREARAVAALKHDHVVTVYQTGEENGVPFLAMELLAGKTLDIWLRPDRRATPAQVLAIGRQIAAGLAAAHAAGLVHRDIKPANVWLEAPKGRVKLLDFGLARGVGGGDPGLTGAGDILGTPAYMAPEQARGQPLDHRCDLFSLGCVLYRMAAGRPPFQGDSAYAVIVAVASEEPAPPRAVNPAVPPALEALILSLLEKEPARRPESAEAVLAEMGRIAAELDAAGGGGATTAWADEPAAPPARRATKRLVLAAAAVGLLGLLLVLVFGSGSKPPPPAPDEPPPAPPAAAGEKPSDPPADASPKPPDPPTLGPPNVSMVGTWGLVGGKAATLVFHDNGMLTGDKGFNGKWGQDGRKVWFSGTFPNKDASVYKVKGMLGPAGDYLRFTNPKGVAEAWQRR